MSEMTINYKKIFFNKKIMNETIIEIIWFIAAFWTTASFLPQALQTIKTKDTKALSLPMYILFTFWVFMWLIYWIWVMSYPVIIANAITLILAWIILWYKIKYK